MIIQDKYFRYVPRIACFNLTGYKHENISKSNYYVVVNGSKVLRIFIVKFSLSYVTVHEQRITYNGMTS